MSMVKEFNQWAREYSRRLDKQERLMLDTQRNEGIRWAKEVRRKLKQAKNPYFARDIQHITEKMLPYINKYCFVPDSFVDMLEELETGLLKSVRQKGKPQNHTRRK